MADSPAVWGIEIGQSALKAVKLRYAEAAGQAIAVAFEYVPHPKILSQPDAVPEELIPQALEKFLSRNDVHGDKLVISVPSQTALTKFVNLPPVPANKVPEIVKYEARQTIPFALEDVFWDYQVVSQGSEESDFLLDAEVGIVAMKRDEVMQRLNHFLKAKVEVDQIQIASMALFNMLSYDQLGVRLDEESDPDSEDFTIGLDMGADNTTLVVTNGAKIWIRNVPVGGNHFTRALSKDMKLTFAKAEHLKCNATKSPDPRAVFQALRPVFNDYVSEIQRSIGYFSSVNRSAKIKRVVGVGNGFKLAGLQKFLQQNLQYEVDRLEGYKSLVGDSVVNAALFQENVLSFAVPYGLALQGLGITRMRTTLLPPEIATERKIRAKKPWAAVAAAVLLCGISVSGFGQSGVERSVGEERWGETETKVGSFNTRVSTLKSSYETEKGNHAATRNKGEQLISNLDRRERWLSLYKALNEVLPYDEGDLNQNRINLQNRVKTRSVSVKREEDLSTWYSTLDDANTDSMLETDRRPPVGPGYLITIQGYHYHEGVDSATSQGANYVRDKLVKKFKNWFSKDGVPIRHIGLTHAAITDAPLGKDWWFHPDPRIQSLLNQNYNQGSQGGGGAAPGVFGGPGSEGGGFAARQDVASKEDIIAELGLEADQAALLESVKQYDFTVQVVWQPVPKPLRYQNEILIAAFEAGRANNKEVLFEDVLKKTEEFNAELVKSQRNKERLDVDPIQLTQEYFDEFRKRHFEKPEAVDPDAEQ